MVHRNGNENEIAGESGIVPGKKRHGGTPGKITQSIPLISRRLISHGKRLILLADYQLLTHVEIDEYQSGTAIPYEKLMCHPFRRFLMGACAPDCVLNVLRDEWRQSISALPNSFMEKARGQSLFARSIFKLAGNGSDARAHSVDAIRLHLRRFKTGIRIFFIVFIANTCISRNARCPFLFFRHR